jgi:hypothetical protein
MYTFHLLNLLTKFLNALTIIYHNEVVFGVIIRFVFFSDTGYFDKLCTFAAAR